MQRPLQIAFKNLATSPALEALVRDRVQRLEALHPRMTGCRVVIEVPYRAADTGKVPIAVSVEADIPGRPLIVGRAEEQRREAQSDQTVALNSAFEAVERQLTKLSDLQSNAGPRHVGDGEIGMVIRLVPEQGYGFIQIDNSPELHFTRATVVGGTFDDLQTGMMVMVTPAARAGPMGPQASSVRLLDRDRIPP